MPKLKCVLIQYNLAKVYHFTTLICNDLYLTINGIFSNCKNFNCCLLFVYRTDFYVIMKSPTDKMGFPSGVAKKHVNAVCILLICVI